MSALVRFLAGFCRGHPLDEKILIVPAFGAGREIGEALARQAGAWVNLRFVTTAALAAEVLGRSGGEGAARPLTPSAELALTDRLFRELLAAGELGYFGRAGSSPGLARALHGAVRELRLDGRTSADLRPELFLVPQKGRELALLLGRYERALDEEGRLDLAGLLAAAAKLGPMADPAWILCPADLQLGRLEAALIRSAAGDRLVLVPGEPVFGLERPPAPWPAPPVADAAAAGRLSWLFDPGRAVPEARAKETEIEIFRALGPANECREILRRIYAARIPFDQVEVLTPPGTGHQTIFHLLAARTNLPVTFGDGLPVSFTSPGRLFFGLAAWLADNFSADGLCRLLENGDLVLPPGPSGPPLPARTACRHLRSAMIGWGRERYADRLAALRDARQADLEVLKARRGGDDDGDGDGEGRRAALLDSIAEIESLAAAVGRILALVPEPDAAGACDLPGLCRAFARLLRDHGQSGDEIDRRAAEALLERLEEFAAEGRFPRLPLKEALDLVRTAGASLRVGASPSLPGHLHVAGLATGGRSGRPVTFVAGLDEAAFPGRGLQDPVLLDEERAGLSEGLPSSADVLRSRLFGLAAVLASLRGRVTLSYSSFDLVDGRASFPSSVVLQAFRLNRGDAKLDYGALEAGLPEAAGFRPGGPERAFDEPDWWLDRLAADPRPDGALTIAANFPGLAAGLAAAEARAGAGLTAYDGIVDIGPLRAEVDPLAGRTAVMSPTRLEQLAKCPFAYFLRHVLGVQAPEEVAYDRSRWLDPLQRGNLVHAVLCAFMTEVAAGGEGVEAARHAPLMRRIAEREIAATRRRIPPPSDEIFEAERKDVDRALRIFLDFEQKRETKGRPLAFEKPIEREEMALPDGRSFLFRGVIDRVDRLGPDEYRIIDYKTGSPAPYEDAVQFGRGRNLQPALYAVALERMLARERPGSAPRVVESGYLFTSLSGEGHEIMIRDFDRARLRHLLGDLLALLEKGYFLAGPEAKCGFCDYRRVCVSGGAEGTKNKMKGLAEADIAIFEAYKKLDEYK
ncbi:MAG TPA: PD-(D/E)XK nuclease family protein [Candidatus Aminicenantes bacterium]|nr:PD-(D/E)XK nuclease family protein [Candidatus Aminicenantes bacterium]HRY64972.1 PD-(D/E)XK nuclease family protein [Candidatus Aminicenantes bacterium]HRZ71885.1 PD-(D/E)XK nuclease family protein [Candidatus Aminicenantes bacterium]